MSRRGSLPHSALLSSGYMRGKWVVLSASVTLLALVAIAVTVLPRVSAKKTKASETAPQAPPSTDINLLAKIRAQQVIGVAPQIVCLVGAFFVELGRDAFEA